MIDDDDAASATSRYSSVLERTLEHRFLADLCSALWCQGIHDFAVSKSEVDQYGYDVVIEVGPVVRHIQLKTKAILSKTARTSASTRLARKQSGCVVWIVYRPSDLAIDHFLWFGGLPGEPMPALGDKKTKHTKGDSTGLKKERPEHRVIAIHQFSRLDGVNDLIRRLFGDLYRLRTLEALSDVDAGDLVPHEKIVAWADGLPKAQ